MTDDVTTSKRLSVPTDPARALRDMNRQPAPPTVKRLSVPTNPARTLWDMNRQPAPPTVKPAEDEVEDRADNTTILQSDKHTHQQTGKQSDPPTGNPTSPPTNKLSSQPAKKAPTAEIKTKTKVETGEVPRPARIDGRTMRARQPTADRTMVTSLRLAVDTVEALDDYCWQHRQRKQDVVQAALDMYFAAQEGEEA